MKIICILYFASVVLAKKTISERYAKSNNNFAIDLFKELARDNNKNVVYSTFPIETILGLTALGAKGDTAAEIKHVLQLPSSDDKIKSEFDVVHTDISRYPDIFSIANQIFLAKNIQVEQTFIDIAKNTFRAGVQNVDFQNDTAAVALINNWVEEKTNHKIKNLLDELDSSTRMVLVNTLHFKANWQKPFDQRLTTKKEFHLSHDKSVLVDTMELTTNLLVYRNHKHNSTIVRIPYAGTDNDLTLAILIPDYKAGESHVRKSLKIVADEQKYNSEYTKLSLPKFRVEASIDLKPVLKELGIKKLFDEADLSGIAKESLKVNAIAQKVFIDVDENGTEAASATAEIFDSKSAAVYQGEPKEYKVDRPFIYCILFDEVAILSGRVTNPSESNE